MPLLPPVHTSAARHPAGVHPRLASVPADEPTEDQVSEMLGTPLLQRVTRDLGGMGARCIKRSNRALLCTLACILSNSLDPIHHYTTLTACVRGRLQGPS